MPSLSVCPDVVYQSTSEGSIITSPASNAGYRQNAYCSPKLLSYNLSWSALTEVEAQALVDLFLSVFYNQVFDVNFPSSDIDIGSYRFGSNSFSVNAVSSNNYEVTATIEEQKGI